MAVFLGVRIAKIHRKANMCTDTLAKYSLKSYREVHMEYLEEC